MMRTAVPLPCPLSQSLSLSLSLTLRSADTAPVWSNENRTARSRSSDMVLCVCVLFFSASCVRPRARSALSRPSQREGRWGEGAAAPTTPRAASAMGERARTRRRHPLALWSAGGQALRPSARWARGRPLSMAREEGEKERSAKPKKKNTTLSFFFPFERRGCPPPRCVCASATTVYSC